MTLYERKSFTVPASSEKGPANCLHLWKDEKRKRCILCGEPLPEKRRKPKARR